ncbi:MAG: tRNA (adenosine(37)-N6)-threonylcarbamoyltransferase complex ATPase subunit type 1 TsaE [Patescibacteria group bacterium]
MQNTHTIHSLEELTSFAPTLVKKLEKEKNPKSATILTLSGNLGAGKTTLTQAIARTLGIDQAVRSPTFIISKEYPLENQVWDKLVHIDAYRLDDEPLEPLGFEEFFADPAKLIIIEWPEYLESILPPHCINISITIQNDDTRALNIATL